jgi:acetyl esterase/lipase
MKQILRSPSARIRMTAVAVLLATTPLPAQRLLGAADLPSLTAPPPDQRLAYGPGPLQFGNLRLPKKPGPHPVLVFVHGGCWLSQYDIAHAAALEQAIADSGIAVWSIEYRRVGNEGGGWPNTFTDVAAGADYLRTIAPKYGLDLNRVVVGGHSAGGAFALWLAARKKISSESELYTANPLVVKGVFGLAPAPDLDALSASGVCGKVIDRLMGGTPVEHADRYAAASPMRLVPIGVPQSLVVGAKDASWSPIGRAYFAKATAAGDTTVRLLEAPESGHFELIAPASSTWPIVIRELKSLLGRHDR